MLSVQNLTVSYGNYKALDNITLDIAQGRLVGMIGPNGAGKSTLMKALLGLVPMDRGRISVWGKSVKKVKKKIAYVPQRSNIDWDFPINVQDTVLLGTYPSLGLFRRPGRRERQLAASCLEEVGLSAYARRQIGALSGGQQQRIFLARALAQQASVFLLDEPFVGIDASSESTIIKVLKRLRDEGKTVIVVHHDLSRAREYFDDLVLINKELVASGTTEHVLDPEKIAAAYKVQMPFLQAV